MHISNMSTKELIEIYAQAKITPKIEIDFLELLKKELISRGLTEQVINGLKSPNP